MKNNMHVSTDTCNKFSSRKDEIFFLVSFSSSFCNFKCCFIIFFWCLKLFSEWTEFRGFFEVFPVLRYFIFDLFIWKNAFRSAGKTWIFQIFFNFHDFFRHFPFMRIKIWMKGLDSWLEAFYFKSFTLTHLSLCLVSSLTFHLHLRKIPKTIWVLF